MQPFPISCLLLTYDYVDGLAEMRLCVGPDVSVPADESRLIIRPRDECEEHRTLPRKGEGQHGRGSVCGKR